MIEVLILTAKKSADLDFDRINELIYQLSGRKVKYDQPSFLSFLKQTNLYQFAAFKDGLLVGLASLFIVGKIEGRTGLVEGVVVDRNYRRQGIGSSLMKAIINQAKRLKLSHLDLTSRPARIEANKFYRKLGFSRRQTNVYRLLIGK